MLHRKKAAALILGLFLTVSALWAGDVAVFVDLGFSPDGRTFMFGQYGVQSRTIRPWAELFIVDVQRNNFVSGGRFFYLHDNPVVSGQDGSGALNFLIAQSAPLAQTHRINYSFQGQPLFISLCGSNHTEAVEFRNFNTGAFYRALLIPTVEGSGESLRSSFFINLERTTRDGSRQNFTLGTPAFKRPFVSSYRIQKVLIAPNASSMIFVIEMRVQDGRGTNIRYMVEAIQF